MSQKSKARGKTSKQKGKAASQPQRSTRETNPAFLRAAMLRRLVRRLSGRSELSVAPIPALLEHYVQMFNSIWASMGRTFTPGELDQFRTVMKQQMEQAFAASPYSRVIVSFETDPAPKTSLTWRVAADVGSVELEYDSWVKTRTPPLFGTHPDAKVMALARSLGAPAEVPVLDIGAGTGRNTLPLAREGFPTDAVELAPALAKILREEIEKEGLPVRLFEGDAFDPSLNIPEKHYRLILLSEVVASHFRDNQQLRALFDSTAEMLASNGLLAFSTFLSSDGYKPDDLARQLSQVLWCNLFTRRDVAQAQEGMPFERVSDESALEFERANLPPEAWPPTGWFEAWSGGQDLFDLPQGRPPMELRWLVYRRT
jgi:SAM-dependent methyltransferase